MKVLTWVAAAVVAAALCGSSAILFAQDAKPAAAQEKKMKKEKVKVVKLTKPWNQIASLSDEQKAKINEIHKKAVEDRQAIDKREHEEAMAVLTEEQRTELAKMKEDEEVARKAKKGAGAKKSEEKAS